MGLSCFLIGQTIGTLYSYGKNTSHSPTCHFLVKCNMIKHPPLPILPVEYIRGRSKGVMLNGHNTSAEELFPLGARWYSKAALLLDNFKKVSRSI